LAVSGWEMGLLHQKLDAVTVIGAGELALAGAEPVAFQGLPPGVEPKARTPET